MVAPSRSGIRGPGGDHYEWRSCGDEYTTLGITKSYGIHTWNEWCVHTLCELHLDKAVFQKRVVPAYTVRVKPNHFYIISFKTLTGIMPTDSLVSFVKDLVRLVFHFIRWIYESWGNYLIITYNILAMLLVTMSKSPF